MTSLNHIGAFIRSYRQANKQSLQALANRSGVSKSMIAQIESGQKSPTVVVLAKLAQAMSIRLGDLVDPPIGSQDVYVVEPNAHNIISKKDSPFICHQLMSKSASSPNDFYRFYFTHYGKTAFSANTQGSVKYLWLEQGELTLYLASATMTINAEQGAKFNASMPHRFENRSGELAKGTLLVTHPKI